MYQPRTYRNQIQPVNLVSFQMIVKETDLHVLAEKKLKKETRDSILYHRGILERYIEKDPRFLSSMIPWIEDAPMPKLVYDMVWAGRAVNVGPMASVAGTIAACVGMDLLAFSKEVIVENGGDIFIHTELPVTIAVFAGTSPLSLNIGLSLGGDNVPMAICTSSGTIGHSHSFGKADAVCVVSSSCALADAAATAIGNRVKTVKDIEAAIEWGKTIKDIEGILIIVGEKMGIWGPLELVPTHGKKG